MNIYSNIFIYFNLYTYMNGSISFIFYYLLSGSPSPHHCCCLCSLPFPPCTQAVLFSLLVSSLFPFQSPLPSLQCCHFPVENSWEVLDASLVAQHPGGSIRSFWPPSTSAPRPPAAWPSPTPSLHLWALCTVARQSHTSSPLHLSVYAGKYCFQRGVHGS